MNLTILEVLENAFYNLKPQTPEIQREIGIEQLKNAIDLLDQGKDANDRFGLGDLRKEGEK